MEPEFKKQNQPSIQEKRKKRNQHILGIRASVQMNENFKRNFNQITESQSKKRKESRGSVVPETPLSSLISEKSFHQNYVILEKLGEGAHGVVKKCIHTETKKQYAVKILTSQPQHALFLKNNFHDIKNLKHSNIIKYKAIYLDSSSYTCYLIMEYLPFKNLLQLQIKSQYQFIQIFKGIFDGLAYAHSKNIVHRDIKPENILYDQKNDIVKIIDFGVSKNMKKRGCYEKMLTITGTPYYRAPEMFEGSGYTEKADSWATGISLFKLICGYTPFESEYHSDTIENIRNAEVHFDQSIFSQYSPILKNFISRLLKKNPKERLSCEEAKQHVFFTPLITDIDLMKSDLGTGWKKTISVTEVEPMQEAFSIVSVESIQLGNHRKSSQNSKNKHIKKFLADITEEDRINDLTKEYHYEDEQALSQGSYDLTSLSPNSYECKKQNKSKLDEEFLMMNVEMEN